MPKGMNTTKANTPNNFANNKALASENGKKKNSKKTAATQAITKSPANKGIVGKHWYTNGIEDKQYFPEEVPEGWVKGRSKVKGRKQSEEEKQKRREAALKRTDYHKFHLTDEQKQKLSWAKKEYYGSLK